VINDAAWHHTRAMRLRKTPGECAAPPFELGWRGGLPAESVTCSAHALAMLNVGRALDVRCPAICGPQWPLVHINPNPVRLASIAMQGGRVNLF